MYNKFVKTLKPSYLLFAATILFSAFLLFYKLGETYLVNWDEAWFASVAREIIVRGNYITPYWNGKLWFYEPPLLTWILAVVLHFTDSHFWLRFPNALSGLLVVALTYIFGWKISKNHLGGFFSSIILISNIEFLFRARQINTEIPLSLFLTLALFGSYISAFEKKRVFIFLTFVSLAFAVLTKRATVLLSVPAILYTYYLKKVEILSSSYLKRGVIVFFAIALPWYILNAIFWKLNFLNSFFLNKTFYQVLGVSDIVGTSPTFYFKSLAYAFKLFFPLLVIGGTWVSYKSIKNKAFRPIVVYSATFLLVLTAAPLKASWYMVPAYPVFSIACGIFILFWTKKSSAIKILALVFIPVVAIFQLYNWRTDFIVPDTSQKQARMAMMARDLTKPGEVIYLDDFYSTVATYYSQREVIFLRQNRIRDIVTYPKIPQGSYILTNDETFGEMSQKTGQKFETLEESADLLLVRAN